VGIGGPFVVHHYSHAAEARRRLLQEPEREIGMALLDQRNLAGIGNLYRTEVLFLLGITPWTPVHDVDLDRLVARSARLMRANRGHWEQSTTGNLRGGQQHWVFERAGKPCRRCGQRIRRTEQGEAPRARVTYWCPRCQVGPQPTG
jgi:endonuclease-8